MNLKEKIITVNKVGEIPRLHEIKSIPRGLKLKIIFEGNTKAKREEIGRKWKIELPKYSIGIHTNGIEINILKLITDKEIEEHQDFFEASAMEYGVLSKKLIQQFIEKFKVQPHEGFPLKTLNPYGKKDYEQVGEMGEWRYYFHGFHCGFTNKKTGQHIEVPLTYGEEFGELDPYFFSGFIQSTPKFQPLPVQIYDDYGDGKRILEVMLNLGKFEEINSNIKGRKGIIVANREKKQIRIFDTGIKEVIDDVKPKMKKPNF
ncbi:MAG: hypothetical protein AAF990_14160, partial [Bacteroidota bacterium]